ncbi:MAG: DUF1997 domain-containing protein [Cyanobium sp.]
MSWDERPLTRRRPIQLDLDPNSFSGQLLGGYLALVDRPLMALLARERLQQQGQGRFNYHSRPLQLLHLELHPSLRLEAVWQEPTLQVLGHSCRIEGLGAWGQELGIVLRAELSPVASGLLGWAEVAVSSPLLAWPRTQKLINPALDLALERIERRVQRGLRKDLEAWLAVRGSETDERV